MLLPHDVRPLTLLTWQISGRVPGEPEGRAKSRYTSRSDGRSADASARSPHDVTMRSCPGFSAGKVVILITRLLPAVFPLRRTTREGDSYFAKAGLRSTLVHAVDDAGEILGSEKYLKIG